MMTEAWSAALTSIEDAVTAAELALRDDAELPDGAWSAPTDLGPMPIDLAERAQQILTRAEQVQAVVRGRMAGMDQELSDLDHRRGVLTAYVAADTSTS